jgi:hypothetical protein
MQPRPAGTKAKTTSKREEPTADEAKAIARDAFVFGLPLVYIATTGDVMTYTTAPRPPIAPLNQFAHFRELPDASNKEVVGLNVDTLYSLATLDLTRDPIVLSIPDMGKRWWLMQLLDAWNDVFAAPGTRTVGGKGGNFAIVGPSWRGKLPGGLTEYRADTNLVIIGGRTYTAGKDDDDDVHRLQDQYRLTPLSRWGTRYEPPTSVALKRGVDAATPVPKQVFAMSAEQFFSRLNELLPGNPARSADAPIVGRMAKLGIGAGLKFSMDRFSPEVRQVIEQGVALGQEVIRDAEATMGEEVNGWQLARDLGRYGTRYARRAAWTFFAVGGNLLEDAFYPFSLEDADGNTLTGEHAYVLRFAKDQVPPVDAFWSLTLYDADSYLAANPIDRYARGDRDELQLDADGSLTLYIQRESPGTGKDDNWLPAPSGAFKLALRLYGPKPQVTDGTWVPPAIRRVS